MSSLHRKLARSGFTLIELLIVIAIIGVLTALLLPAVQKVREMSARTRSSNNLAQIMKAVTQYADVHRVLPDFVNLLNNDDNLIAFSSPFTKILPFVEQENLYNLFLQTKTPRSLEARVPVYIGPLDTSTALAGMTSYVSNGYVFNIDKPSFTRTFQDGASQTLMFTERFMACGDSLVYYNAWPIKDSGSTLAKQPTTLAPMLSSTTLPVFGMSPLSTSSSTCASGPPSSPYSSGILVALGDSSVRFVSRDAANSNASNPSSSTNWEVILSPAGGDTPGPDW
jgi:prepilin-type N-terminal cleavage/methylation domain-containing protein